MRGGVVFGYLQRTIPFLVGKKKHRGLFVGQGRIAFSPNHYHHHHQQLYCQWQERIHRSRAKLYSSGSNDDDSDFSQRSKNVISSPKSTTVKKVVALLKKRKKRSEFQQTVVEGPRIIFDLLENPKTFHLVRQILISSGDGDVDVDVDGHKHKHEHDYEYHDFDNDGRNKKRNAYESRLRTIISKMETTCFDDDTSPLPQIQFVTPDVFYHCCSDTVTPQGIAAIVDTPNPNQSDQQSEATHSSALKPPGGGTNRFYLVLDAISDPGNTGTLIRSGLAAGVSGIILLPGCCDVWNPKSVRSAMGASFQIPIYQPQCWDGALELLQSKLGVKKIYAATMIDGDDDEDAQGRDGLTSKSSIPYYDIDWTIESSALIIGSEGNGLGLDVRDALFSVKYEDDNADVRMQATHIPMQPGIESLNAAVCGSIVMFEYSRQQAQQQRRANAE